jgi:protein-S-isoprenylcysteine O-methyltransferase Ste14
MRLRDALIKQGGWLFRWRSFLPLLMVLIALPAFRDSLVPESAGRFGFDDAWALACVGVSLFGMAIRFYAAGYAPAGTSGRNTKVQRADALNTAGGYSLVRHPLYVGNFFVTLGVVLVVGCWWFAVLYVLLFALFYERIIATEENYLGDKFGARWEEWAARTPLAIPRFKNYRRPELPFSLRAAVSNEYHVVFNVILAFVFMEVMATLMTEGRLELDTPWRGAALAGFGMWLTIRILKKHTKVLDAAGR